MFICEACSEQHVAILGQSAQIRVATGDGNIVWSTEDVAKMHAAGNNVAVTITVSRRRNYRYFRALRYNDVKGGENIPSGDVLLL